MRRLPAWRKKVDGATGDKAIAVEGKVEVGSRLAGRDFAFPNQDEKDATSVLLISASASRRIGRCKPTGN